MVLLVFVCIVGNSVGNIGFRRISSLFVFVIGSNSDISGRAAALYRTLEEVILPRIGKIEVILPRIGRIEMFLPLMVTGFGAGSNSSSSSFCWLLNKTR